MNPIRLHLTTALFVLLTAFPAAPSVPVRLPAYEREVLSNGIVLYLVPRPETPLVTLLATFRGGAESEDAQQAGTCATVAGLLRKGTASLTAAQFSSELDRMGARFDTDVDAQSTTISLEVLSREVDRAAGLFADAIMHPVFPPDEVQRQLARSIDDSRLLKDSPGMAVWYYFCALLFGREHPYGHPSFGDELSLPHITRSTVMDYYRRMYVGRNLILVAAGEFTAPEMRARLIRSFSQMPAGRRYEWMPAPAPRAAPISRLMLVDKPDATQTDFVIGVPGISRTSPDRTGLWLANTIFGGAFTSVLNEELRVNSGLTYGVSSNFDQNRMPGAIEISSSTGTVKTEEALDKTLAAWSGFCGRGISAEQLASAKTYVKGTFPPDNLQTAGQVADTLADLELFGLGRDEVDGLFQRVDSVTLDEVNAVTRKYFCSSDPQFVLVGNAAQLRGIASKYAPKTQSLALSSPGFDPAAGAPVLLSSGGGARVPGPVARAAKRNSSPAAGATH